jgi:DnaK suppressor protein
MDREEMARLKQHLLDQLAELSLRGKATVFELSRELSREADYVDQASTESQLAQIVRLRTRERTLINKIKRALQSMDEGEYGLCEACGEEISSRRLWARPVTTLCIRCKSQMEEVERRRGA